MSYDEISNKIAAGAYKPEELTPRIISKPRLPADVTAKEARDYADRLDAYEKEIREKEAVRAAHRDTVFQLERVVFRDDIEVAYGTKGNPKADMLWSLAWDRGHSNGLYDVLAEYDSLAGLIL